MVKKIYASLFSAGVENFSKELERLRNNNIKNIHFDVMDNIFVPNTALTIEHLKKIDLSFFSVNVHLMVSDVKKYLDEFCNYKVASITFHCEANSSKKNLEFINFIKKNKIHSGIAIKPKTNLNDCLEEIKNSDLVTVMSVEPGFGGQAFINETIQRIDSIRKLNTRENFTIEVDGGLNETNLSLILKTTNYFVVGSALFKANDIAKKYLELNKFLN